MEVKLKPYQDGFIFDSRPLHFLKSGWGTGKTLALLAACTNECQAYPNNLVMIVRKEFTDLRDSTMKDFVDYTGMHIGSDRNSQFPNGSTLMFRHAEEIGGNNLQNINLGAFGIEQAEEFDTDDVFFTLFGRLRRNNSSGKAYVISNAKGHNWIYKLKNKGIYDSIADPEHRNRLDVHYSATSYDNSDNLSPRFFTLINTLKEQKPNLYNRFVLNQDDDEDTIDIIIPANIVRKAINRKVSKAYPVRRIIVCDPARYGDDETVTYVLESLGDVVRIVGKEIYNQKSTMETAGRLSILKSKFKANLIAVDVCGLGSGVYDRLEELGENVLSINSAAASVSKDKYRNVRSEMWAKAAEKFENDLVSIEDDEALVDQLSIVKYKTIESNGRLQVEPKEDIKKRLGRSPDRADSLVMGLWAIDRAEPVAESIYINSKKFSYKFNAATC